MRYVKAMIRTIIGAAIFALGLVLVMRSNVGYGPWEVFHAGISLRTGISIGNVSIIVGFVIIAIDFIIKENVGLATFVSMITCGIFNDIFLGLIPEFTLPNYFLGFIIMVCGMFISAFGAYIYMSAYMGSGARDGLMVAIRRHTKLPIGLSRFILEMCAAFIGWLMGGYFGIGTVLYAATFGTAVQTVFSLLHFEATAEGHENIPDTIRILKQALKK